MTIGERLKSLRQELGYSQEAMGAQGFVSMPGWIKIENGQRSPSDKFLHKLVSWLIKDEHMNVKVAGVLLEEFLTLKYLDNPSAFVRRLAYNHAKHLLAGTAILVAENPATYRPRLRRDRSPVKMVGSGANATLDDSTLGTETE